MNALVKQLFEKPFDVLNVSSKDFDKFFVGFDKQFDEMAKLGQELAKNVPNYPPFNIKKVSDNKYTIEIAVAGFSQSDVDITLEGNKLVVSGKTTDDSDNQEFLFKGIANRAFTRTFALADKIEVQSAEIVNGMLKIALDKMVDVQPIRKIEVKGEKKSKKELLNESE